MVYNNVTNHKTTFPQVAAAALASDFHLFRVQLTWLRSDLGREGLYRMKSWFISCFHMSFFFCPCHSVLISGYVQASKRDKKFVSCPPNFSYAALCECICRTFVYRQPSLLETVLFNRRQGRQIEKVAKQHLASLDSDKPILGFRATNERVYILTCSNIFILKINNN